jgi:hypothetical protein
MEHSPHFSFTFRTEFLIHVHDRAMSSANTPMLVNLPHGSETAKSVLTSNTESMFLPPRNETSQAIVQHPVEKFTKSPRKREKGECHDTSYNTPQDPPECTAQPPSHIAYTTQISLAPCRTLPQRNRSFSPSPAELHLRRFGPKSSQKAPADLHN